MGWSVWGCCQPGVVLLLVTRHVTGRFVRALLNDPSGWQGGAGLAPAVGLIRSLSALRGRDSSQSCRCGFPALRPASPDPTSRNRRISGMLADQVDYVVGVDTHRDEHVLAVVVASTGSVVARRSVATTSRGYGQALRFADEHASAGVCGRLRVQATTGPGSPVTWAVAARGCSRPAAVHATNGGCTAKTTGSTRSGLPARRSRATTSRCRERDNDRKRSGC